MTMRLIMLSFDAIIFCVIFPLYVTDIMAFALAHYLKTGSVAIEDISATLVRLPELIFTD